MNADQDPRAKRPPLGDALAFIEAALERVALLIRLHHKRQGQADEKELWRLAEKQRGTVEAGLKQAEEQGFDQPMNRLISLFGLSPFEQDLLLLALAAWLDPLLTKTFADFPRGQGRGLTLDLAIHMLAPDARARHAVRGFAVHAPVFLWRLLHGEDGDGFGPRRIRLNPRIGRFLLANHLPEPDLGECLQACPAPNGFEDRLIAPATRQAAIQMIEYLADSGSNLSSIVIHLEGPEGGPFRSVAAAMAKQLGYGLFVLEVPRFLQQRDPFGPPLIHLTREMLLLGGALLLRDHCSARQTGPVKDGDRERLLRELAAYVPLIFVAGDRALPIRLGHLRLPLPKPDATRQKQLWQWTLPEVALPAIVLDTFDFGESQILGAAAFAKHAAAARGLSQPEAEDLLAGCRGQALHRLGELAVPVKAAGDWGDLVLPDHLLVKLRRVADQLRYRDRVYREWGFEHKLTYGRGVNVLFSGSPGTGKTLAAQVLATELKLDLYRIDLSAVISKYIGETEKNLNLIFEEAKAGGVILLFDEADALFAKRSDVKDAHDRYANLETGYLLQKIEEFNGLSILATNLAGNMDEAFTRRLQFVLSFPFPGESLRLRILQTLMPDEMPRETDVDLAFLAQKLKMAGGFLKNIVVGAAFLAAADGKALAMKHLLWAARREWEKTGKPFLVEDFEPYTALLAADPEVPT